MMSSTQSYRVSNDGGRTWSAYFYFSYGAATLHSVSPVSATQGANINILGSFWTGGSGNCKFHSSVTGTDVVVSAYSFSATNMYCRVPALYSSGYYNVYVSDDGGHHWSAGYSSFYYTSSSSTPTNAPVPVPSIHTKPIIYYNSQSTVYGSNFQSSTRCLLLGASQTTSSGVNVSLTYISTTSVSIFLRTTSAAYVPASQSVYLSCTNDGTHWSAKLVSASIVPLLTSYSVGDAYPASVWFSGVGFSSLADPTCKFVLGGNIKYTLMQVYTSSSAYCSYPSFSESGRMSLVVSNDGLYFSKESLFLNYTKPTSNNIWPILGPILAVIFLLLLISVIFVRRAIKRQSELRAVHHYISPLETNQIELHSVSQNQLDQGIQQQQQQQQQPVFHPIQMVNQMPMFGYPQMQTPQIVYLQQPIQQGQNQQNAENSSQNSNIPQPYGSNQRMIMSPAIPAGITQPYGSNQTMVPVFMNAIPQPYGSNPAGNVIYMTPNIPQQLNQVAHQQQVANQQQQNLFAQQNVPQNSSLTFVSNQNASELAPIQLPSDGNK